MKPTARQLQLVEWRKRREQMARLRQQGKTLEEIATVHGVSRERVRQLLLKVNGH